MAKFKSKGEYVEKEPKSFKREFLKSGVLVKLYSPFRNEVSKKSSILLESKSNSYLRYMDDGAKERLGQTNPFLEEKNEKYHGAFSSSSYLEEKDILEIEKKARESKCSKYGGFIKVYGISGYKNLCTDDVAKKYLDTFMRNLFGTNVPIYVGALHRNAISYHVHFWFMASKEEEDLILRNYCSLKDIEEMLKVSFKGAAEKALEDREFIKFRDEEIIKKCGKKEDIEKRSYLTAIEQNMYDLSYFFFRNDFYDLKEDEKETNRLSLEYEVSSILGIDKKDKILGEIKESVLKLIDIESLDEKLNKILENLILDTAVEGAITFTQTFKNGLPGVVKKLENKNSLKGTIELFRNLPIKFLEIIKNMQDGKDPYIMEDLSSNKYKNIYKGEFSVDIAI